MTHAEECTKPVNRTEIETRYMESHTQPHTPNKQMTPIVQPQSSVSDCAVVTSLGQSVEHTETPKNDAPHEDIKCPSGQKAIHYMHCTNISLPIADQRYQPWTHKFLLHYSQHTAHLPKQGYVELMLR
jgi:hypothetical protein